MQRNPSSRNRWQPFLALTLLITFAHGGTAFADQDGKVSPTAPLIVLVPGFFNSLMPTVSLRHYAPYFSSTVVDTVASRGAPVVVVDTLLAVADVERNGDTLVTYLDSAIQRFPGRKIVIIAHSAGGLYTLRALTKRPDLPVITVVTIGTPYAGVEFIDQLRSDAPFLETIVHHLNLDSIREFEASKMAPVLASFVVPKGIRWITIAGELPPCNFITNCNDAKFLSRTLSFTQSLMHDPSDGVVTVNSALAQGVSIRQSDGGEFPMERWSDFTFPLEHMSQVKGANFFNIPEIFTAKYVAGLQHQLFTKILDRLHDEVKQSEGSPTAPVVHAPSGAEQ